MKYITPAAYWYAEDSVPGAQTISPQVMARYINRAETIIDTFVGFDARFGGFEQHTAWYQAAFDEKTLRTRIPNFPVPVINVNRYRIQVSNMSNSQGFFADINNSDVAINVFGGYIEIVPLQAVTYSLTPFMLGLGLQPPLTQVDYTAGFYFPQLGERLDNISGDLKTYRALRGFWASTYAVSSFIQPVTLPPVPPVVYVNGATQLSSTYTIDMTEGVVTFNSPLAAGSVVTADYTYTIPEPVANATIAQVTWMLQQRNLNLMGLGGIEVARSRDQQIKRHIRTSADASSKDEPAICPEAMQYLEPYTYTPLA